MYSLVPHLIFRSCNLVLWSQCIDEAQHAISLLPFTSFMNKVAVYNYFS